MWLFLAVASTTVTLKNQKSKPVGEATLAISVFFTEHASNLVHIVTLSSLFVYTAALLEILILTYFKSHCKRSEFSHAWRQFIFYRHCRNVKVSVKNGAAMFHNILEIKREEKSDFIQTLAESFSWLKDLKESLCLLLCCCTPSSEPFWANSTV